jgi:hypothetical protein
LAIISPSEEFFPPTWSRSARPRSANQRTFGFVVMLIGGSFCPLARSVHVWKRMADIASTDHLELGGEAPVIVFATARFAATAPEKPRRPCCQQYGRLHV